MNFRNAVVALAVASGCLPTNFSQSFPQASPVETSTPIAASAPTVIPYLVPYSRIATGVDGASSVKAATLPEFELQAERIGNNSTSPAATLNLLYNPNGGTLTETGLSINANGAINFVPGQTFPGAITGVTPGADLTSTISGGVVTLNLNTAATNALYAQLATSNNFGGTQSFSQVGIGTTTPRSLLEIQASAKGALGPVATLTNTLGGTGAESALDFNIIVTSTKGAYNPMARIVAQDVAQYSDNLLFQFNKPGAQKIAADRSREAIIGMSYSWAAPVQTREGPFKIPRHRKGMAEVETTRKLLRVAGI